MTTALAVAKCLSSAGALVKRLEEFREAAADGDKALKRATRTGGEKTGPMS